MIFEALFNKDCDDSKILYALSNIFNLSNQKILITDDVYSINIKLDASIEILCGKTDLKRDFFKKISIYLRSNRLKKLNYIEEDFFSQLCRIIDSECLISDDSNSPYTMILLNGQSRKKVTLVPEDLEKEIYTIENDSCS